jgi:peptidoglycan/xylan/chitin deacetylase (PgdA/CDA1 family)
MSRHALIRLALDALSLTRAPKWLPAPSEAAGFIVTLHHVGPKRDASFQPNRFLSITPEFLDRFLGHFIALGWRFVSVDEIVGNAPVAVGDGRRRIAVTLDDGYRDNFQHAWPVFRRHSVPFTIYVCAGFCDRTSELWWEALDRIVANAESVPVPGAENGQHIPAGSTGEKLKAYEFWKDWLTTEADEALQRVAIRELCAAHGLDLAALAHELVMDWDEVREIAADPLASIGAHTLTHPALARLAPNAAFQEMSASADRIASETGRRPTSIAFPYGHRAAAGAREAGLAEQAGFAASLTTRPGHLVANGSHHGLPRVSLNGLFQNVRYMETLLSPGLWAMRDRLRRGS